MSAVYMLNSAAESTPPCGTPVLNWRCDLMCDLYMLCRLGSLDIVCDELDDYARNLGL